MNKALVIGSDHHNTLGVIRGLGERGVRPDVLLISGWECSFVGRSKYIDNLLTINSSLDIYDSLNNYWKKNEGKAVVFCCGDSIEAQIDKNYNRLKDYYHLPGTEIQGRVTELMSKRRMSDLACEVGLRIPRTWYYDAQNTGDLPQINNPCIVKPLASIEGSKEDIRIVNSPVQLQDYLKTSRLEQAQIQEFIDKDFEYQLIGCSTKKEVIIPGVSKILRPCKGSNTSFLHYTQLEEGFCDIDKCVDFVRRTGYYGLFSLEFLRDKNGKDYFMEINFRNDGNAICTTAAGVSLPYVWYLDCIGQDYSVETNKPVKSIYVMPDMAELKLLLSGQINLFQYIGDLRKTGRFMEYDKNDPKPFWRMLKKEIQTLFKKKK